MASFNMQKTTSDYELIILATQYLIDNLVFQIHKHDLIHFNTGELSALTVELMSWGLGNGFQGYDKNSTCEMNVGTLDPYPKLVVDELKTLIYANLSLELLCKEHLTDTEFHHTVNLVGETVIEINLTTDE